MTPRLLIALTGCWFPLSVAAQTLPALDQNPATTRWNRLRTPHVNILYPDGSGNTAQRTARRLEQVYVPVSASLGRQPRRISVVLQNQTTVSNGFVSVLPRKAEFNTTAPQAPFTNGTLDWLDELAVHEFRHVVQQDKALTGVSLTAFRLLGNSAIGAIGLGIPDWFAEGDAVGTETVLTRGGRGRIPNFDLGFRANLLAGRRFSYAKSVGGSYRDNVPNHYPLGYLLTTFAKRTYGVDVWDGVLNRYYRFPFYPFSFSNSLRKVTGLRVEELYRQTMDDVTEAYRREQASLKLTNAQVLPARAERQANALVFTSYRYPQWLNDSTLLAVKSGLGDIDQLVSLRRGKEGTNDWREDRVFVRGYVNNPDMLSVAGGRACWIEYDFDPRWGQRIYSDVRLLDLATGRLCRLTRRGRYTAAALSPAGNRVVAVRNDDRYHTELVVLDAQTGADITVLNKPDDRFYSQPRWSDDGQTVVVAALVNQQKTIEAFTVATGAHRDLLPLAVENISHVQPWGSFVFYNSPRSGLDNLYALDVRTGRVAQVTSRSLGAYHAAPSPNGQQLAFHEFSADGYRLARMPLDTSRWQPAPPALGEGVRYFGPLLKQDPNALTVTTNLPDSVPPTYRTERYQRLAHALNIYSWGPVITSSGQALQVGLASQDLLNTTQLQAGYAYNQSERTGNFFANLSYQGLYPIIDLGFQSGNRRTSAFLGKAADSLVVDNWHYNQVTTGLRLPLNLTRSRYAQSIVASAYYSYQQVTGYDLPGRLLNEVGNGRSLSAMTYSLSYGRSLKQSQRDAGPRRGQAFSTTLRNTPFGGTLASWQWGTSVSVYLPGLGKHHSLRLRGAYQQQWGRTDVRNVYQFSAVVAYPRGAAYYVAYDQLRFGSAEYRLPLLHPHWNLGRLLYVQRVKSMLFTDYADGQSRLHQGTTTATVRRDEWTAGADVSATFNLLRFRTPFEVGLRTIRNIRTGQWLLQPLVIDIGF